jgi:hypothetical protein
MDWANKLWKRTFRPFSKGAVQVGWLFNDDKNSVVFVDPERVKSAEVSKSHAKSASRCPAIISLEARYFLIRCPFDISLGFYRHGDGKAMVKNLLGDASPMRPKGFERHFRLTKETEWRYPDRPTIQIVLPYVFVADEPVYLNQLPPFMHVLDDPWPGTLFGGRFPIHIWPRSLTWAFEWRDTSKPLILKRGAPWFYVNFETAFPDRLVEIVEAENTPELKRYLDSISGAVNYVNQTFSLFKTASARRPKKLLKPLRR